MIYGKATGIMAGATEIYICTDWQRLEEAALEYSNQIENSTQAKADAEQICLLNPKVRKIAYYAVSENGSCSRMYTYENPHFVPVPIVRSPRASLPQISLARARTRRQEASLWSRIMGLFMEAPRPAMRFHERG